MKILKSGNQDYYLSFNPENNTVSKVNKCFPESTIIEGNLKKYFHSEDVAHIKKRLLSRNIGEFASLDSITIILTHNCNMRCRYCLCSKSSLQSESEVDLDLLRIRLLSKLDERKEKRKIHFRFYGGEPLLYFEHLKKIVLDLKKANIPGAFSVTTNGTLINIYIIKFFVEHDFLVTISCDGPPETHDRFRIFKTGKATSLYVESAIKLARSNFPTWTESNLTINAVLTPNYTLMDRLAYFLSIGVSSVEFLPMSSSSITAIGYSLDEYNDYFLEQYTFLCKYVLSKLIARSYSEIISFPFLSHFYLFREKHKPSFKEYCGIGIKKIAILPSGDIIPCHEFASCNSSSCSYLIGNLVDGINCDEVNKIYDQFLYAINNCGKCWMFFLCSKLCPASILKAPNMYCDNRSYSRSKLLMELYIKSYAELVISDSKALSEYLIYVENQIPISFLE